MNRSTLLLSILAITAAVGCTQPGVNPPTNPGAPTPAPSAAAPAPSPAPKPAAGKWYEAIAGTYKGVVGGNNDAIVLTFRQTPDGLTATYTIDDAEFNPKPYSGKLSKFTDTPGKERTLSCRYEDAMNAGSYVFTFSPDLKELTGTYVIDNEDAGDENKVSATRQ